MSLLTVTSYIRIKKKNHCTVKMFYLSLTLTHFSLVNRVKSLIVSPDYSDK